MFSRLLGSRQNLLGKMLDLFVLMVDAGSHKLLQAVVERTSFMEAEGALIDPIQHALNIASQEIAMLPYEADPSCKSQCR
jgi:hypothetical protein